MTAATLPIVNIRLRGYKDTKIFSIFGLGAFQNGVNNNRYWHLHRNKIRYQIGRGRVIQTLIGGLRWHAFSFGRLSTNFK